jgi:uroporphyrin-III C-methyltransferase/precorrin-2 dehydrogenase/sirohydrochlorin ferrochelatase
MGFMEPELFPLFLKIAGRTCLVVGAGKIAEAKIESLVRCGAKVRVVAPTATEGIRQAAEAGTIAWERRTFAPSDLAGVFMVIAATSSPDLHEQIFRQAQRDGILCNAVDEPERCDFYYPAIVRRGPLQIAISTGGRAPALAQRLRRDLEAQFGPGYGPWVEQIGRARSELMIRAIAPEERRELLRELSSAEAFEAFQRFCSKANSSESEEIRAASEIDEKTNGIVYFLGAGPGDPELLTRKAWKILTAAEVVLHDALVAPEIVRLAHKDALVCDVGKRCGQKSISQEEIHAMLVAHASAGHMVVRLQGGDPLIFGRAGEEMTALRRAGIDFEIVPGVTAASAAAATARIPLTDRRFASRVIFLSAHRRAGELRTDQISNDAAVENVLLEIGGEAARKELATGVPARDAAPCSGTTLAIYMPGLDYGRLARDLLETGWGADTPCLLVSQASMAQERVSRMPIAALSEAEPLPAPAILIVGDVAAVGEVARTGSGEAADQHSERTADIAKDGVAAVVMS